MSTARTDGPPADITEIECWSESRELVTLIYAVTSSEDFADDSLLIEMLRTRAIWVMSKISDGYHRRSIENFISSLEEAKGYLGEVISYLYVAFDQEYLSRDVLNDTLNKGYTVGIHINSYLKTLKNY